MYRVVDAQRRGDAVPRVQDAKTTVHGLFDKIKLREGW